MHNPPFDAAEELRRLLPRLAADSDSEIMETVTGIRRALDVAGFDFHDLAHLLTFELAPNEAERSRENPADRNAELLTMALILHEHVRHLLTKRQAKFLANAKRMLKEGEALSLRQEAWLRDLHRMHGAGATEDG